MPFISIIINPLNSLSGMDYAYQGQPFVRGVMVYSNLPILYGMDYSYQGQPFVIWSNI